MGLALYSILTFVFLSGVYSCPTVGKSGEYSYNPQSDIGPSNWGSISGFETCSTGSAQSPINIETSGSSPMSDTPSTNYLVSVMNLEEKVENWALECASAGTCGSLSYNGQTYEVLNLHFHSPSEHTINGKRYPLEAHVVHINGNDIKVMGFLFDIGLVPNTVPALIINSICLGTETLTVALDLLVDTSDGMCSYDGSLTTPPCSETVQFFIQQKVLTVTEAELDNFIQTFNSPIDANSRPIQPLNGRPVMCTA